MPGPRIREEDGSALDWPSKRIRLEAYGVGAVVKVRVHNFM
ncbi:hypothetical protein WJX84_009972, partial [Apatococcus fuscideae]